MSQISLVSNILKLLGTIQIILNNICNMFS